MSTLDRVCTLLLLSPVAFAAAGCSKPAEAPAPPEAVVTEEVVEEVEVPAVTGNDVTEAMAGLSEADRTAALAQKICPVSDEPLGSMGTPIKVTVGGRDVFLCCENCKQEIETNPDKYLAKLDAVKSDAPPVEAPKTDAPPTGAAATP